MWLVHVVVACAGRLARLLARLLAWLAASSRMR